MKKRFLVIAATFSLVLAFSIVSFGANEPTNTPSSNQVSFSGKVLDSSTGELLTGVEVRILNTDIKTYTDLDGNFNFSGIPNGTYDVVLSLISYNKSLLDDIKVESGKTTSIDVKLISTK